MLEPDAVDDGVGECGRTSGRPTCRRLVARGRGAYARTLELCDGSEPLTQGVLTVSIAGTTCRSMVEMLRPSASEACLRL